jgi:DNA-binding MarR family transcriptional regulator
MTQNETTVDLGRLRVSAALASAQTAMERSFERNVVATSEEDGTTLDLLLRLASTPGHRMRAVELCRQLMLSPSHISRRVDRAQSRGLVVREPDPEDRRAAQVVATDKGLAIVDTYVPKLEAVVHAVVEQTMTEAEADMLVELLNRVEFAARDYSCPAGA